MSIFSPPPQIIACPPTDVCTTLWKIATAHFKYMETDLRGKTLTQPKITQLVGDKARDSHLPVPTLHPARPAPFLIILCVLILISQHASGEARPKPEKLSKPATLLFLPSHWFCKAWIPFFLSVGYSLGGIAKTHYPICSLTAQRTLALLLSFCRGRRGGWSL